MFLYSLDDIPYNSSIAVYGAGKAGVLFKKFLGLVRKDIKVVCFIDSFNNGEIDGIEIFKIDNLESIKDRFNLIVVVSTFWTQIQNILQSYNIQNFKVLDPHMVLFIYVFLKWEINHKQIKDKEIYLSYFNKVKLLLNNEEDRKLYDLLVDFRLEPQNRKFLTEYALKNLNAMPWQYFEYINKEEIKIVIEGGVFDGYVTKKFLDQFPNLQQVYGFEPFYETYLKGDYASLLSEIDNITILPLALWEKKSKLPMLNHDEASYVLKSNADQQNVNYMDAVSIDEFVAENDISSVDFLKLDIEGAEMNALKGAEKTILSHRPQMAICIYHSNADMYQIPLYLDSILEDYEFRLGHYTDAHIETVLYAIPKELAN